MTCSIFRMKETSWFIFWFDGSLFLQVMMESVDRSCWHPLAQSSNEQFSDGPFQLSRLVSEFFKISLACVIRNF